MSSNQQGLPGTYAAWMGMPVVLNVATGEKRTSLFCTIIGESDATLRVRIADQWDVDVYKEMVLAVDAFPHSGADLGLQNPGGINPRAPLVHLPAIATVQPRTGGGDD